MGYEIDSVEKIEIRDKETGEKIGEVEPPLSCYTEETISTEAMNEKLAIKGQLCSEFTMAWEPEPRPNILFIISPGREDGKYATKIGFYRPKEYNWFQRFMYKICFGITVKQGNEVRREFL